MSQGVLLERSGTDAEEITAFIHQPPSGVEAGLWHRLGSDASRGVLPRDALLRNLERQGNVTRISVDRDASTATAHTRKNQERSMGGETEPLELVLSRAKRELESKDKVTGVALTWDDQTPVLLVQGDNFTISDLKSILGVLQMSRSSVPGRFFDVRVNDSFGTCDNAHP